ncbi:MAG TPA: FimV/HubP family polar landmark protein [Burkholderiaceae bacterium]|nr:FimV/HubP family polar landmark protein [Burkholderiaceae bacterium]
MSKSRRGSGSAVPVFKAEYLIGAVIAATLGLSSAQAATFGHSRIVSALGQPLHVEIPVSQLTPQELATLRATPAPADAWRAASMTPPVALDSMRLVLLDGYRPDVKVIQLRSDQPFDQPIVDVLLDIRSASGQQRYQVSLLAHADPSMVQRAGGESARHPRSIDGRDAGAPTAAHVAEGTRITVRRGDTMFAIAQRNAVPGVTVYQMMIALQRANPQAFIEDNVNLVKAGATLIMPDADALTALSDREARRIFQQHAQAFARYRQRSAAANVAVLASDGAAAEGGISANDSGTAASAAVPPASGDRLRLSGESPAASVAAGSGSGTQGSASPASGAPGGAEGGISGGGGNGGSANSRLGVQSPSAQGAGPAVNLLASSGAIASDAVSGRMPDASSGDASSAHSGVLGNGTAAGSDNPGTSTDPDDRAAVRKGTEESQKRVLELEDNLRHINEALQKQGHVAAEAALEGARSVSEALMEAIGVNEPQNGSAAKDASASVGAGAAAGASGAAGEGATAPGATANNRAAESATSGAGTPATTPQSSSRAPTPPAGGADPSRSASEPAAGVGDARPAVEKTSSWFERNVLAVVGGGLALLLAILVWLLRRAAAAKRDAFESDSPITDTMVREKLSEIDLELDRPSTDTPGRPLF